MRWAYELNDFSFDIIHKPGKEQVQSDALSRREQDIPCDVDNDRIANRHHQLLEGDTESLKVVAKATWIRDGDADSDKELMAPTKAVISITGNAAHHLFFSVVLKAPLKYHLIAPRKRRLRFQHNYQSLIFQLQNWQ